jgi:hypothetical protein
MTLFLQRNVLDDIEYLTRKLIEYKKWELEINLHKTHNACFGQEQSDLLLEGGELIKQCTECKYLGIKINREGAQESEMNGRI